MHPTTNAQPAPDFATLITETVQSLPNSQATISYVKKILALICREVSVHRLKSSAWTSSNKVVCVSRAIFLIFCSTTAPSTADCRWGLSRDIFLQPHRTFSIYSASSVINPRTFECYCPPFFVELNCPPPPAGRHPLCSQPMYKPSTGNTNFAPVVLTAQTKDRS